MRSADSYVPLHRDCQGHVDRGTEGHGRHGVQQVDICLHRLLVRTGGGRGYYLGQEGGDREPVVDSLQGGVGVDWDIENNIPGI